MEWRKVKSQIRRSHLVLRHEEWFRHAFKACGDLPEEGDVPIAIDSDLDISDDDSDSIASEGDAAQHLQPPVEAPPLPPPLEEPEGEDPGGPGGEAPRGPDAAAQADLETHNALVQLGDAYQPSAKSAERPIHSKGKNTALTVARRFEIGKAFNEWRECHQGHRATTPSPHRIRLCIGFDMSYRMN